MQFQLEMRRLELAAGENQNNNNNNNNSARDQGQFRVDLKRFPEFKEKDNPEAFLISFERACNDLQAKDEEKMVILRARISGTLAERYAQMPEDQSRNFDMFKHLIYTRFGITSEQLREKFRRVMV
ncbi:Hypothetical predicted protein [Podarcis lilfordi]|uniref:Uncharacterized protein n=1 Tax=Podarcis lilfordi TaxID=74358 RepID=A0AA35P212_9SAUR|nr:Hypothetical predicted protein [Podarcis lilfordi]